MPTFLRGGATATALTHRVTKEQIMDALGDELMAFAAYCHLDVGTDADAPQVKWLFENISNIDPTAQVFQDLMALMVTKTVLTQDAVDRVNAILD